MNTIIHNANFYREEILRLGNVLAGSGLNNSERAVFERQIASARRHLAELTPTPATV
ncbi:MAG: hypothetical protein WB439_04770 [Acidobacteriaceae bacterium]